MKNNKHQVAIHRDAIARWFAKRRKTTIQKVLLDLSITPPSRIPEDVFYLVKGKRTEALVVSGKGEVWLWMPGISKENTLGNLVGNVFEDY